MNSRLSMIRQQSLTGLLAILLPWIVIIGFTSSVAVVCTFLLVIAGLVVFGQWFIEMTIMPLDEDEKRLLYLPAGYMVACGLTALGVRTGVGAEVVFWALVILAVLGILRLIVRKSIKNNTTVPGLWPLAVLSLIISLIYYLPGAIRDAVYMADGSYNWMHVDTQYFTAIAASVKSSVGAPKAPGVGLLDLSYHFGPYAVAGVLSSSIDIPVGDSLVRVFRPIAILSLILACYAMGRFLAREAGQATAGGVFAVAGLFFYGSIASLFTDPPSSSAVSGAILFNIPNVAVPSNGGPFAHLILGHSQVHGLNGLLVLVLILLSKLQVTEKHHFSLDAAALGPAFLFPTSIILGIAVLGLYVSLYSWFGKRHKRTWLTLGFMICTAIFSAWAMEYNNFLAAGNAGYSSGRMMQERLFPVFVWFYIGLGVRLFAFTKIKNPFHDPVSATILVTFSGFILFSLLFKEFDSRYGFLYAQGILCVFSFSWLAAPVMATFKNGLSEIFPYVADFMRIILITSIVFLVFAISFYLLPKIIIRDWSVHSLSVVRTLKSSGIMILLSLAGLILMKKAEYMKSAVAVALTGICLLGTTGWITDWANYGLGRLRLDVHVSEGEVQGLETLRRMSSQGDLICTNKHSLTGLNAGLDRSYAYGALSERPVLLEGWDYAGLQKDKFESMYRDNELIFASQDSKRMLQIIDYYGIKYVVAKPGTSLANSSNMPDCLKRIQDTGSLEVYMVAKDIAQR